MVNCPHCSKSIHLSAKAKASVKALAPDKVIRIKCPACSNIVRINRNFQTSKVKELSNSKLPGDPGSPAKPKPVFGKEWIRPPDAPDISWLQEDVQEDDERVGDDEATLALVLVREEQGRESVVKAIEGMGYRVELVDSSEEAIEKMEFGNYAMVALHSRFEGPGINTSVFHMHMRALRMAERRYIFYFLIGPEFQSLYELQALIYSANLVVNDKEIPKLGVILLKKIPEYETLFGKIIEEIRIQGKIL